MGQRLGRYIKTERRNKKISVKIMGEKTGISKSYLDYIESGAREPQVEMLAKIAVILQVPIETLLNIQQKEQLELAITKLKASNVDVSDDEIRAVARTADSNLVIDEQALAQTQEAFRTAPDDKQLAEYIENPNLKAIVRAGAALDDENLNKLRKVMESLYPDAFKK
jgi:XRE family transcriptional regulator of biofilm formation